MNKKGQYALHELLLVIGELALASFVLVGFFIYLRNVEKGAFLEKSYNAREISLIVETLESAPGSIFYHFADEKGFIYSFKKNRVDVYTKDERFDTPSITYYLFPENKNLEYSYPQNPQLLMPLPFEENTEFDIQKGFEFSIDNEIDENINFLNCPNVKHEIEYSTYDSSELLKAFEDENGKEVKDIFLKIKYVKENDNLVLIKIARNIKSRRLACLISNELKKSSIDSMILPEDIDKEKTYVLIELKKEMKKEVAKGVSNALSRF